MSTVTFENIFHGDSADLGKLRFNPVGFGWKAYQSEENNPTTYNGSDIRHATWFRVARHFQLRLGMRNSEKPRISFDGFKRDDLDKIKRTLQEYFNITLETRDTSLKGWNWGEAQVKGTDLVFQVQGKTAFDVPLSQVANSNIAGKNEVALEFNPSSNYKFDPKDLNKRPPDEMVEMRFYIPGKSMKMAGSDAGSGGEETELDEEGNEVSAADAFHSLIKEKADIGAVVGDSIVVFEDCLILTPRGRFSIEVYTDSIRLVGKSTDHRVPFSSIHRIFLLPKLDDLHVQLVLGLDPPIRQGATRYPFLVAQWPKDEVVNAELNLTDEELTQYPDLEKTYEATTFQVVSRVLKALTGKKVTPPGSLRNAQGLNGIRANVKAVQGELYFLEKGLIFISKQPILIDFSKTDSISFSRVGGGVASARTFDMRVVSKTGGANHVFSAINKQEVGPISSFLQSKNIRLKNEMEEATVDIDEPFSDDDEEMESPSEDERPSKAKNDKSKTVKKSADDDEDESEDEDFEDASSDGGSPSESDSDEDSGMASDASDPMMEELRKKNQAKRAKAKETSGSASEDEKPKKKKAKKEEDE
ncbi:FACT complex subunit POB3 [Cryptococcus gattii E566]|uniref:FACT complex subunit POB3 n=2 Tax=Cryptococcus gattii TaxID=37769 RepID=E6REF3_CRYGW|nr:Subunit of the heterodimeric FACT complex, putative; Pob3p [Cryptococcus gattii WM276]ADV25345.1 Subunit of the heterodimeric FACT complex, putative; Pob3p [Cryptococcus gattii WM276]KIR76513.1 FACT complex subunit POB3 [Cryptococcus gattii EJB2]KIY32042.1 FACT complex subunit POB3 [Cryptococcus gattii E566]KJD99643.1 FACT complex subunit POB3 [Cryptococcus gattii NT-10]